MLDARCEFMMAEFLEKKESFEKMRTIILDTLKKLIDENHMMVTTIEGRVKTEKSLRGKLELKGYKYGALSDITDLIGCRVVTFYVDEVDKIASLVEQSFIIDWENSVDKRKALDTDRFGYMSLHYICQIPKELYYDEAHPEINEVKFEVQMRTALQHVWATAYHDTGYKSDVEIPKEYIRALSRLAGVLEIADQQFSSIIVELADYRRRVSNLVKDGKLEDLELNGDTFKCYLDIQPFSRLNERIAAINKAEIQPQSFAPYLSVLKTFGLKTLGDVESMKKECEDDAYRLAVSQIGGTDLDILSETIGIQNLCTIYILKKGLGIGGLKIFFDTLYGEKPRNIKSAERVAKQAAALGIYGE